MTIHSINIPFETEEMIFLKELKDSLSWHDFILKLAKYKKKDEN